MFKKLGGITPVAALHVEKDLHDRAGAAKHLALFVWKDKQRPVVVVELITFLTDYSVTEGHLQRFSFDC